jgi:uncharacterized protein YegP (UPF0339 family)
MKLARSIVTVAMLASAGAAGCAADESAASAEEDELRATGGRVEVFEDGGRFAVAVVDRAQNRLLTVTARFDDRAAAEVGAIPLLARGSVGYAYFTRPLAGGTWVTELLHDGKAIATTRPFRDERDAKRDATQARAILRSAPLSPAASDAFGKLRFALRPEADQYRFELRDRDGAVLLRSERYRSRSAALAGIDSVHLYATGSPTFQIAEEDGKHRLSLVAYNGESIGWGQLYPTKDEAERAASAIAALLESGVPTIEE